MECIIIINETAGRIFLIFFPLVPSASFKSFKNFSIHSFFTYNSYPLVDRHRKHLSKLRNRKERSSSCVQIGQDHSRAIRYAKWFRRRNMDFVCQTNRSINLIRWTLPSTVSAWRWTLIYPHRHTMSTAKTMIISFLFRFDAFHSKVVNLEVNGVSTIVAIRLTMNEHDAHPVSSGNVRFLYQCVRCVAGPRTPDNLLCNRSGYGPAKQIQFFGCRLSWDNGDPFLFECVCVCCRHCNELIEIYMTFSCIL